MDFVHIHTHSDYSCLQSLASVAKLVERCSTYNMPGMALTDIGNLYGAMEFFELASRAKINPIIGSEFYIQSNHFKETNETTRLSRAKNRGKMRSINEDLNMPFGVYRVILLAETDEGYKNLIQLSTLSYDQTIRKFPTITFEQLSKYKAGLICISGGRGSELFDTLKRNNIASAKTIATEYLQIFGKDHYFLEIEDHNHDSYRVVTQATIELSEKLQLPLIACNEVHYLDKEDWYSHEVMLCIANQHLITTKKGIGRNKHSYLVGTGYHFKSEQEMAVHFEHVPAALKNTLRINDRCRINIRDKTFHMPKFTIPDDNDPATYIENIVAAKLKLLFKDEEVPDLYWDRVRDELEVINSMGFAEYFLIVADIINAARERSILVGPGRGSIVGSLVGYVLGITDLDPIHYDLLFERFLTKGRVSMPDIDIDFQDDRRDEVIEYIRMKYGMENTCQIITYGRLKARAVFKDVSRVFNIDFQTSNRLSTLISSYGAADDDGSDSQPLSSLQVSYENSNELKNQIFASEQLKQVYLHSLKLENLIRQTSIHAAGVVIADKPLHNYIPLTKNEEDSAVSQYDGRFLESHCGLLKMDILGLRALSLIQNAVAEIRRCENEALDWREFPLNDSRTFQFFTKGMTVGIFQFESEGMTRYLQELRPHSVEELTAMNALYRPGPLAWIPVYIARKHGRAPTFQNSADRDRYLALEKLCDRFDLLSKVLAPTKYIPVFQEQIMQICRVFAGFSLAEADSIRKAMGKKDRNLIASFRKKFIDGAMRLKHKEADAVFLYDEIIEAFAGYGFNKSHAAGYAILAYRVAYIKANFPAYFIAAFLNSEINSLREAKMRRVFQECSFNKITILPPDINTATTFFQNRNGTISFAFNAIKGISKHTAQAIVAEREKGLFTSFSHFLSRMTRYVETLPEEQHRSIFTKQTVEALIKAQCFDSLYTPTCIEKNTPTNKLTNTLTDTPADIPTKAPADGHANTSTDAPIKSRDTSNQEATSPIENSQAITPPTLLKVSELRADILLKLYASIQSIIDTEINMYRGGQQSLFSVANDENTAAITATSSITRTSPYILEAQVLKKLKLATPSRKDVLKTLEKEILAFNFREDPTLKYTQVFKELTNFDASLPSSWTENKALTLAGILEEVMIRFTKKNNEEMSILKVNNGLRVFECVCFPKTWAELKNMTQPNPSTPPQHKKTDQSPVATPVATLVLDMPIKIMGFFKKNYNRNDILSIVVNKITPITTEDEKQANRNDKTQQSNHTTHSTQRLEKLIITFTGEVSADTLTSIKQLLEESPKGNLKVYLVMKETHHAMARRQTLFLGNTISVQLTETLRAKLRKIDAVTNVELC
ncbi:DNA polymerase III subunit alpha [Spirochaetota bacterium]|nr:DNA polymerase III subunit alpha [Spirochaetota bacterium]